MFDIVVDVLLACTKLVVPLVGLRLVLDTVRTFLFQK